MTDREYELLCQLEFHGERMRCLSTLLDAFDAAGPFSLISEDTIRPSPPCTCKGESP